MLVNEADKIRFWNYYSKVLLQAIS